MRRVWTFSVLVLVLALLPALAFSAPRSLKNLPNLSINSFAQDSTGYMWIATDNGLCRFNGAYYLHYYNDPADTASIPSSKVLSLVTDGNGVLWVATDEGLCWYRHLTDTFVKVRTGIRPGNLEYSSGTVFYYGEEGIVSIDSSTKSVILTETSPEYRFSAMSRCEDGSLIACRDDGCHVSRLDAGLKSLRSVAMKDTSAFFCVTEGFGGCIWVGRGDGLMILDGQSLLPAQDSVSRTVTEHVGSRKVTVVFRNMDRMYACSPRKGVMSFFSDGRMENTTQVTNSSFVLNYTSDFSCAISDIDGFPWIGTKDRGYGIRFYTKKNFKREPFPRYLEGKYVNAITADEETVWFGSYYKGVLGYDYTTRKSRWENYTDRLFSGLEGGIKGIESLLIDSGRRLWIGTPGRILCCKTEGHVLKGAEIVLTGVSASCFKELPSGEIWAATDVGLICCSGRNRGKTLLKGSRISFIKEFPQGLIAQVDDEGPRFVDMQTHEVTELSFSDDVTRLLRHVNDMLLDTDGDLWVGTSFDGILKIKDFIAGPDTMSVERYTVSDGLGSNEIAAIVEDLRKNIWVTTSYGISVFSDSFEHVVTYDLSPLLDIKQFCHRSVMQRNGRIVAGGNVGAAAFIPSDIIGNTLKDGPIRILFTDLLVNGIKQEPAEPGSVLHDRFSDTNSLVLRHNQNNVEIGYEAISFLLGDDVIFSYRMTGKGFDNRWVEAGNNKCVTFSGLPPGRYVFELIAKNQKGDWNESPLTLDIKVKPSPWMNGYSIVIYLFLLVASFSLFSTMFIRIKTKKLEMEAVKDELDREKRMSEMKQNFFSNVSHELRNSLSLIYGPVMRLKDVKDKKIADSIVDSINLNTKRLLSLTDMTLDLSRIENDTLPLTITETPVLPLVRNVISGFNPFAAEKGISLTLVSGMNDDDKVVLDVDKMVTILSNLISNALKYTQEGGNVQVRLSVDTSLPDRLSEARAASEYLIVTVYDDGIGMKKEETEMIFKRYVRLDDASRSVYGTGIGLHYVQQLLKVHGGAISASLRDEGGMSFSFAIPIDSSMYDVVTDYRDVSRIVDGTETQELQSYNAYEKMDGQSGDEIVGPQSPKVLFIEDNLQLLKYCLDTFAGKYQVHWASNGHYGFELVNDIMPDIVVTDVNMPEMNGYELCSRIKGDSLLSHISVIMLTAKADEKDKIEGYKSGADIYITKPFDAVLLMTVMDNILEAKRKMKEHFVSQDKETHLEDPDSFNKLNNADKAFIEKLRQFIDNNIADTDININVLADEMNLSRSSFFRKMKSMTGMTPNDFILAYRLNKAADLIREGSYRINEISDLLGFSSPSHFSKVFKQRFGMSPKAFGTNK